MSLPSPFTYFKNVYCINLSHRMDRWAEVTAECEKVGISGLIRVEACTTAEAAGNSPFVAFNTSQLQTLQAALKADKWPVLILEDDCVFKNITHLHYAMNELTPDWEVLYLGANILGTDTIPFRKPERHSAHLFRVLDAWMTQSMVYSKKGVERILSTFSVTCGYNFDEFLRQEILPAGEGFIIAPQITYQRPGYSDIWNNSGDYTSLFERGNQLLK